MHRAFLCGDDKYPGQNFEHHPQWMVVRIRLLTHVFLIEVCAYAIMSNHYHFVLYVNEEELLACSDDGICVHGVKYILVPRLLFVGKKAS